MCKINIFILFLFVFLVIVVIGGGTYYFSSLFKEDESSGKTEYSISSGVVPHHLLAEEMIETFFEYVFLKESPESIVLLSPDHFNSGTLCQEALFLTLEPGSRKFNGLEIDNNLLTSLNKKTDFCFSNASLEIEHGITGLLPFIKKHSLNTKILPVLIPFNISKDQISLLIEDINSLSSSETIVIASVDFSHYLPKSAAEFHDAKSIRVLLNFEKDNFKDLEVDCWQCLYGIRMLAELRQKEKPKIIGYANSLDFINNKLGDKEERETTSYFSLAFEEGKIIPVFEKQKVKTVLFVGDIMLNRGVEHLMNKNSTFYPFEKINQLLKGVDIAVGNLEGPIIQNPPQFSPTSLRFAFHPEVLKGLSLAGFNLLSLANNHTFDTGEVGFKETKNHLSEANIDFVGYPIGCDKDILFEKEEIIFLALNKTLTLNCSDEQILEVIDRVRIANPEKFLIVLLHWGEEYQLKSSLAQQKLGRKIIDIGADLIIGHHPHVVQEIEEYRGRLIFYSLGNFIFDQYFSKETQQGLAIGLEIYPQKVIYRIFPLKSRLSQPFLMEREGEKEFINELARKSSPSLFKEIEKGMIIIERPAR